MAFSTRRKTTIIALASYWPILFILTHMPIPIQVQRAGVSDKALHFAAYLILAFLVWFSVRPIDKVRWNTKVPWILAAVILAYAVMEEWLQTFVGRGCDLKDILADASGVAVGFIIFTFLSFWPASLAVTGIVVFTVSNVSKINLSEVMPIFNAFFHFFGYAFFTASWLLSLDSNRWQMAKAFSAVGMGVVFLTSVKICSLAIGQELDKSNIAIAVAAIVLTAITFLVFGRGNSKSFQL